jgi:hypothetical protein
MAKGVSPEGLLVDAHPPPRPALQEFVLYFTFYAIIRLDARGGPHLATRPQI